jgi:predicted NAD-dependent protein-ADP-ribosyltransferase YbiA (DUF1768 family)
MNAKMPSSNPATDLHNILSCYLSDANPKSELECRFWLPSASSSSASASPSKRTLTKLDMDRVVGNLLSAGYVIDEDRDLYYLRITPMERVESGRREQYKSMHMRLDIQGLESIQKYCKTNTIPPTIDDENRFMRFTEKKAPPSSMPMPENGAAFFADMNYSFSYKWETHYLLHVSETQNIIDNWNNSKKMFRLIKRCRFRRPENPAIFVDVSIVKSNRRAASGVPIPAYTLQDAGIFDNPETYEIELEANNDYFFVSAGTAKKMDGILSAFRPAIHHVLSALQASPLPLPHSEQDAVLGDYLKLIYYHLKGGAEVGGGGGVRVAPTPTDFLGPSSMTLQIENVVDSSRVHVLRNYVVTDKADGERKLLFICPYKGTGPSRGPKEARIYLIDVNMRVTFTGRTTTDTELFYTMLDGEHVVTDSANTFLAFDYYFGWSPETHTVQSYCNYPFFKTARKREIEEKGEKDAAAKHKYRYTLLKNFIRRLASTTQTADAKKHDRKSIVIDAKDFVYKENDIFEASRQVLNRSEFAAYPTDGLIFTPCDAPVPVHHGAHKFRVSWEQSFKWKPPKYNTIDFFVSVRKNRDNQDFIKTSFHGGLNMAQVEESPCKVIELHCGYDPERHRYVNAFATLLQEFAHPARTVAASAAAGLVDAESRREYTHQKFVPTNPCVADAYLAFIPLTRNELNQWVMKTEQGETFTEGNIVEFAYDVLDPEAGRRWKPLRVRYDKTANLLAGRKEFGNAFHVADSIWHSIHFPLTRKMMETGRDIRVDNVEIYYEKTRGGGAMYTDRLRKFHNMVKRRLIGAAGSSVTITANYKSIIDLAVGKAGDLYKWKQVGFEFVYGIDYSADNIKNSSDGACVRFLKDRAKDGKSLHAMFAVGDSSRNIREGEAFVVGGDNGAHSIFQQVATAVFGGKPMTELGKYNGAGKSGFSVCSCQFALHYFFKNAQTLHGFLRNVAENTQMGGYFIGTTYDGDTVFRNLQKYKRGEGIVLSQDEKIYFQLIRGYDHSGFPPDESSLGYSIHVFQESIGKSAEEYLVNFSFFESMMKLYGFRLAEPEIDHVDLPSGTGLFRDLYDAYNGAPLTEGEKTISMMNRFFVFKKHVDVDAKMLQSRVEDSVPVFAPKPPYRKIRDDFVIHAENEKKPELKQEPEQNTIVNISTREEENEVNKNEVNKNEVKEHIASETTPVALRDKIKDSFDEDVVFVFYAQSAEKPRPGEGAGEKIPADKKTEYAELHRIPHWRRKLSNAWPAEFELDGHRWASVEHYFQGSKFKNQNHEFYLQFSVDSGSELSKDPELAKKTAAKPGKKIKVDGDFEERVNREMLDAQRAKFTQNADLKALLLATKRAKLMHFMRGMPSILYENLVRIRSEEA